MENLQMARFGKYLTQAAAGALLAAAAVTALSSPASARVACNRYGDCWRVADNYTYPPALGVRFYSDSYYNHRWPHRHWRTDHPGRGYWRNGVWITF
jgi:hypothetical protein